VGDIVSLATRRESPVRPVDRAITERAAAQGGVIALDGAPEGSPGERRLRAHSGQRDHLDRTIVIAGIGAS
jgi:hypothetical protein